MADEKGVKVESPENSAGAAPVDATGQGRTSSRQSTPPKGKDAVTRDREERLRLIKERQNEERQRKLEELKQQALAAQKFREQKEEERRRRMEELRQRDSDRRLQVEERKRQIWEAERDRREAILRKNQEREARIDSKRRNERSSAVFAFGSSTPRMLEPADTGGSFWGTRRATSTSNVMMFTATPLTRRSSERELEGSGKKRATSASGLDRKPGEDMKMSTSMYEVFHWDTAPQPVGTTTQRSQSISGASYSDLGTTPQKKNDYDTILQMKKDGHSFSSAPQTPSSNIASIFGGSIGGEEADAQQNGTPQYVRVNRRKTDLMPTIPSPRDTTPSSGGRRAPSRSPGLRSGEVTPSRPVSALSQHSVNSVGSGTSGAGLRSRPATTPRRPRPYSIAVTGVSHESTQKHLTGATAEVKSSKQQSPSSEKEVAKPPLPRVHSAKKPAKPEILPKKSVEKIKSAKPSPKITPKVSPLQSPDADSLASMPQPQEPAKDESKAIETKDLEMPVQTDVELVSEITEKDIKREEPVPEVKEAEFKEPQEVSTENKITTNVNEPEPPAEVPHTEPSNVEVPTGQVFENEADMTASMIAKARITTEEEAKAALAERRRLAREQAEREAELERQRVEEERLKEEERQRQEEEEQRRFEEEQLRLVEEARKAEEQRLLLAIQENERKEKEEKKRREEEIKAKAEKEEAERKAREEAERLRKEMDERLKKEEEERIARRKRVEAIMLRTRGKGATPTNTPTKAQSDGDGDAEDLKEASPLEENKTNPNGDAQMDQVHQDFDSEEVVSSSVVENGKISTSEQLLTDENIVKPMEISDDCVNSASNVESTVQSQKSNGQRNGVAYGDSNFSSVDNLKQNNAANNLLEFNPFTTSNVEEPVTVSADVEQNLDLNLMQNTGKLANEDNVNSNVTTNGPNAPIITFEENRTKKQDTNSVTDLLS